MPQPATLQVTLSEETLDFVKKKIASGEFASESDVLNETVAAYKDQNEEVERWLHEVGVPTYDRMKADPSRGIPIEEVERHFEERRRRRDAGCAPEPERQVSNSASPSCSKYRTIKLSY